jgi:hypothetical protein
MVLSEFSGEAKSWAIPKVFHRKSPEKGTRGVIIVLKAVASNTKSYYCHWILLQCKESLFFIITGEAYKMQ